MTPTPEIAQYTSWLVWLVFFPLVIAYEFYARNNAEPGSSLSAVLKQQIRKHPLLGVVIGILIGHLAWQQTVHETKYVVLPNEQTKVEVPK